MQFRRYVILGGVLLLSGVVLLMNAQAGQEGQIVFGSKRDGSCEIYVMDADGKNVRRLTKHPKSDWGADWFGEFVRPVSPAGKQIITWGWLRNWILSHH